MWLKSDGRFLPSLEVNLMLLFRNKVNWVSEVLTILVRGRWSICSNRGDFVSILILATEKELYIGKITTLGIFFPQFLEHEVTRGIYIPLEWNVWAECWSIELSNFSETLHFPCTLLPREWHCGRRRSFKEQNSTGQGLYFSVRKPQGCCVSSFLRKQQVKLSYLKYAI